MINRLLRSVLCVLVGLAASFPVLAQWGMNDVTIIYPLPDYPGKANELISPQEPGLGGPWLPQKLYARLPEINQGEARNFTYRYLRVVAVRLDPCFRNEGTCLPQVRLVWQPINISTYGSSTPIGQLEAKDASVHSFYTLTPGAFQALLNDYETLKMKVRVKDLSDEPLQVHPVIEEQGPNGPFAQGLRKLLDKYVGAKTLWRITAMKTFVGSDQWAFLGFNVSDGTTQSIVIPRTRGATEQGFRTGQMTQTEFSSGVVTPAPQGADNLIPILQNSRFLQANDPALLGALGKAVADIENPKIHTPETMDCVSCHAAQAAGSVLFERVAGLSDMPQVMKRKFKSTLPLQNLGQRQDNTHVLRALGYVDRDLVLSRRVINETADVAEKLNQEALASRLANSLKTDGQLDFSKL
ncbi:MAG: hypothetical protein WBX11_08330 [Thiobacillaceae bacterium]